MDDVGLVTLHEVADHLDVHYSTVYRWVREGDLPAYRAGSRLRVKRDDLDAFIEVRRLSVVAATPARSPRRDWTRHRHRLLDALVAGQLGHADALVDEVIGAGATVGDVYLHLFTPVLHEIGRRWQTGAIDVPREHLATDAVEQMMARLSVRFPTRDGRGTAVTTTPPGEHHGLAAAMVADFVRSAGWTVHHLGPDVPLDELGHFAADVAADVVCISVTAPPHDDVLAGLAGLDGVEVILGGQGVDAGAALPGDIRVIHDPRRLLAVLAEG